VDQPEDLMPKLSEEKRRQLRIAGAKSLAMRSDKTAELVRLTRELLARTEAKLRDQGLEQPEAAAQALVDVAASQGMTPEEVLAREEACGKPVHRKPLLQDAQDDQLDPNFASAVRTLKYRTTELRKVLRRFRRSVEQAELADDVAHRRAPLLTLLQLCDHAERLISSARPYALCPECQGDNEQCPLCGGLWWVNVREYWAWREQNDALPEPNARTLLEDP
jgi:hypothetical protein